jgi:hypothetical protein
METVVVVSLVLRSLTKEEVVGSFPVGHAAGRWSGRTRRS